MKPNLHPAAVATMKTVQFFYTMEDTSRPLLHTVAVDALSDAEAIRKAIRDLRNRRKKVQIRGPFKVQHGEPLWI